MALQIVKFEKSDAWAADTWAVIDTVPDWMMRPVFFDELQALLWVAYVERYALKYAPDSQQQGIANLLIHWLDETAPRFKFSGVRDLPAAWAEALLDTSNWDEESLARRPWEIQEHELLEMLLDSKRSAAAVDYLFAQFGEWEPAQKRKG